MVIRCLGDDLARFVHDKFHGPPPSNAPVSAAAKARSLSNLVPASAFQPNITASVFDMRRIPPRHLSTEPHKIKSRLRDGKYPQRPPSRVPALWGPCQRRGGALDGSPQGN